VRTIAVVQTSIAVGAVETVGVVTTVAVGSESAISGNAVGSFVVVDLTARI